MIIGIQRQFDLFSNLAQSPISVTGTQSLSSGSFGRMHICSGTIANYTVTLPSPTGNSGKLVGIQIAPSTTKLISVSTPSGAIDGAATRIMWQSETANLYCDGTNWTKIDGKSIPMSCFMYQGSGSVALAGAQTTSIPTRTVSYDTNGLNFMQDTTNGRINIIRPANYIISCMATMGVVGGGSYSGLLWSYISKNGSAVSQSSTIYCNGTLNFGYAGAGFSMTLSCAANDNVSLAAIQNTSATLSTSGQTATFNNNISVLEVPNW